MAGGIRHFLQFADFDRTRARVGVRALAHHQGAIQALPVLSAACGPYAGDGVRKGSTRTRVSFEAGMYQMGGSVIHITTGDSQLGRAEPIEDTARVISRMVDIVMIRTFEQAKLESFAAHSRVPVINGLTNEYHPCQILADIFTFIEHRGPIAGRTVAGSGMRTTWRTRGCRPREPRISAERINTARLCARRNAGNGRRAFTSFRRSAGSCARRRPGNDRRVDQHGIRGRE